MKKIFLLAALATSAFAECTTKTGDQKNGDFTRDGWIIDWTPCKDEIEKYDETKALLEGGKIKAGTKEEDVYQGLLKHDANLSASCDNKCHSQYEKDTCKNG